MTDTQGFTKGTSRRSFLRLIGLGATASLMAACAAPAAPQPTTAPAPAKAPEPTKAAAPAPTAAPQPTAAPAPAKAPEPTKAAPAAPAQVTISFWTEPRLRNVPGMEDKTKEYGDYEKLLAAEFTKANPNVKVEVQAIDWDDLPKKIPAAIAAGTPPDVLKDYLGRSSKYAYQNVTENLEELVPKDELSDYLESYVKLYTLNGHLHALPHVAWASHLVINTAVFKAANAMDKLPQPDSDGIPNWTYEQFAAACKAVAQPGKLWPMLLSIRTDGQGDYGYFGYFWGDGAQLYQNADYAKPTLNSPEGVKALEWLVKMQKDGFINPGSTTISQEDYDTMWYKKQAAIANGGLGLWNALEQERKAKTNRVVEPFELMWAPFPHADNLPSAGLAVGPTGIIVFKQPKGDANRRKAAVEFARFVNSGEKMAEYAKLSSQFPTRKAAGTPLADNKDYALVLKHMQKYGVSDMGLASPKYAQLRILLPPQLQAAILGKKTPQQALADYETEALKALKQ